MLLETKLAVRVEGFDSSVPYAEELKIVRPERVFSMDESRLTNDTTEKTKAKANRSIVGKTGDSREVIVNKGGGDGTGILGAVAPMALICQECSYLRKTSFMLESRIPTSHLRLDRSAGDWTRRIQGSHCLAGSGRMRRAASLAISVFVISEESSSLRCLICHRRTLLF